MLEAMYMKKISIVSNCIGNRDVIVNGNNGFVANEINDFIKYIQEILDKKIDVQTLVINANQDVLNEYNIEKMVDKYKKEYLK